MGCVESNIPYRPAYAIEQYLIKSNSAKITCKQLKKANLIQGMLDINEYILLCTHLKLNLPFTFFTTTSRVRAREVLLSLCIMSGDDPKRKLKLIRGLVSQDLRSMTEYLELYYTLKHFKVPYWSVRHLFMSKVVADHHVKEFRVNSGVFIEQSVRLIAEDLGKLESLKLLSLTDE
jgi:hypothetical protein